MEEHEKGKTKKKEEEVMVDMDAIKHIYTPLEEAKEEIWRRWNDKALRKKVEEFLGGDIPDLFKKKPCAVLARSVVSPNFELFHTSILQLY